MGKNNKKKGSTYHPQIQKSDPNKRQKISDLQDKVVPKKQEEFKREHKRSLSFVDEGFQITHVDLTTHTKDIQNHFTQLNKGALQFDFNSKTDFSPDADCQQVAIKFWNWVLNPLTIAQFQSDIFNKSKCLVIQRNSMNFTYDQTDFLDNMIDSKMVMDYLKMQGSEVKFGKNIDLKLYLNSKEYLMNGSAEKFDHDYFQNAFDNQNAWVFLNQPQDFSISLTKAICLAEELFQCECSAQVQWHKYPVDKKYRLTEKMQKDYDQYVLVIIGEVFFYISNLTKEPSEEHEGSSWNGCLKKGDLIYIPKGTRYQIKTKLKKGNDDDSCMMLVLSNQQDNSWKNLLQKSVDFSLKNPNLGLLSANLPTDLFDRGQLVKEQNFQVYCQAVDEMSNLLKSKELFERAIHRFQVKYIMNKQAPQEILQPNEPDEEEGDEDEQDQNEEDDDEGEEEDDAMNQIESKVAQPQKLQEQFKEVKLCSKNGAFLSQRKNGYWLYFSTQNSRIKGEVPKQKMQIAPQFAKAIERVLYKYPQYLKVDKLSEKKEDAEGLLNLLSELAYLQILVVQ